jgi:S-adenosylmethionine synthetase
MFVVCSVVSYTEQKPNARVVVWITGSGKSSLKKEAKLGTLTTDFMPKVVETVLAGHPDKVCDQIADAIVDEYLRRDPESSIDLNVLGSNGMLMIGGEVTSKADFDLAELAKKVYAEIGYKDEIEVFANIAPQSEELQKVKRGHALTTAVVNGYATRETRELMPRPVVYAQSIARRIDDLRKTDPSFSWLQPDGKVQIMMKKNEIQAVTILASHAEGINEKEVQTALLDRVVMTVVKDGAVKILINPAGPFTQTGFLADSGASGRKPSVDTYGALIPHGDNTLSGKDPMKAERAGAYMARYVARWIVQKELASNVLVNIAYVLGKPEPLHIKVQGVTDKSRGVRMDLTNVAMKEFDFRPEAIVERLGLLKPIYQATACYGHFGRDGFPWEEEVK